MVWLSHIIAQTKRNFLDSKISKPKAFFFRKLADGIREVWFPEIDTFLSKTAQPISLKLWGSHSLIEMTVFEKFQWNRKRSLNKLADPVWNRQYNIHKYNNTISLHDFSIFTFTQIYLNEQRVFFCTQMWTMWTVPVYQ